jgi:hypothetical protein
MGAECNFGEHCVSNLDVILDDRGRNTKNFCHDCCIVVPAGTALLYVFCCNRFIYVCLHMLIAALVLCYTVKGRVLRFLHSHACRESRAAGVRLSTLGDQRSRDPSVDSPFFVLYLKSYVALRSEFSHFF